MRLVPFFILLATTAAWFLLPLIPALLELLRPTDAEPLNAVGRDSGDLTVFADGFRDYLARQLPANALGSPGDGAHTTPGEAPSSVGTLSDGTPFVQLTDSTEPLLGVSDSDGGVSCLVLATQPVTLLGGETFRLELYARSTLEGGVGAVYRAVLGDADVALGARSEVLRWAHAAGELRVGADCVLSGRASAGKRLVMGRRTTFRRVRAPHVVALDVPASVGSPKWPDPPPLAPMVSGTLKLPPGARRDRGYTRITGDLAIPGGESLVGALVVTGTLTVGDGARIGGSVKTHGNCILGDDIVVEGTIVSSGSVKTGARCQVRGSLIAERDAELGSGSWIGAPSIAASVAAEHIVLREGAQVYGAISARRSGRVE